MVERGRDSVCLWWCGRWASACLCAQVCARVRQCAFLFVCVPKCASVCLPVPLSMCALVCLPVHVPMRALMCLRCVTVSVTVCVCVSTRAHCMSLCAYPRAHVCLWGDLPSSSQYLRTLGSMRLVISATNVRVILVLWCCLNRLQALTPTMLRSWEWSRRVWEPLGGGCTRPRPAPRPPPPPSSRQIS